MSEDWALYFLEKGVTYDNYPSFPLNRGHGAGSRLCCRMWSLYPQSTFVHLSGKTVCGKTLLVLEPHTCCKNASPTCHCQVFRKRRSLPSGMGTDNLPDFMFKRSLINDLTGFQVDLHLYYSGGLRLLRFVASLRTTYQFLTHSLEYCTACSLPPVVPSHSSLTVAHLLQKE